MLEILEKIKKIERGFLRMGNKIGLINIKNKFYKIPPGKIYLNPKYGLSSLYRKFDLWEPPTKKWILNNIKPGMKILEFGSCLGYFTLYLAKQVGKTGKVVGVEPNKDYFFCLKKTTEKNKNLNIYLIKKFLSKKEGNQEITFFKLLDQFDKGLDFVFLDIEGAETIFFDQLFKTDYRPQIFVELHFHLIGEKKAKKYLKILSKDYNIKKVWINHYWLMPKIFKDL